MSITLSPVAAVASAAKARIASAPSIARAKRAITAIGTRRGDCKTRGYSPQLFEACDDTAIDAYNKLLPRARTGTRRDSFLAAMIPAFQEAQNADRAYYANYSRADVVGAVSTYADFARRRAEILTSVAKVPPPRKPVRGERGLFDWIDRTPDLRESISNLISTREATRRWEAIRTADCTAYPVPRCAERLDDEMRRMIRELTIERPSSFAKDEKRPPRRF
ncbi:hypothetical protein NDN01_24935 [Sphingomonas sp. QA11]|uniref:hypothetical protein n=1 Tax=Sphingomonas sp. QA11 TaxID=2950605 RepID=UPI00234B2925|nr:hypothetical protein [Sphingomonas sp. QA11]WCM27189.1 hypothetical protein NDN01_24935 [Sphingomonas sp. QA11]